MKNKEILITGGTGSLGKALTKALIPLKPKGIRIYSRSELNQFNMKQEFKDADIPISYIIGDIRDKDRLRMAFKGVDYVVNAAAMKRIEVCNSDPLECLKTNVNGVSNVVTAALEAGVEKVLQVSTDKAVYPTTLYGASKKCAEDLILNASVYAPLNNSSLVLTRFMCVRYGNVLGSSGSVLGIFLKQITEGKPLTVTNLNMTRFWITLPDVCEFIIATLILYTEGIHIPKMISSTINDLINSISSLTETSFKLKEISIQVNEKMHESLTTVEEGLRLIDTKYRFIISANINNKLNTKNRTYNSFDECSRIKRAVTKEKLIKMIKEALNDNL